MLCLSVSFFFFFNDTATTEIYTLSLHDALPIFRSLGRGGRFVSCGGTTGPKVAFDIRRLFWYQWSLMGSTMGNDAEYRERSEEHTSELQSRLHLVCRLLLEKKKTNKLSRCT